MSRTSRGTPLSNELLEQQADEAEQGYRPEQLRRRGRPRLAKGKGPSHTLNVRIDDDLRDGPTVLVVRVTRPRRSCAKRCAATWQANRHPDAFMRCAHNTDLTQLAAGV